MRTRHLTQWLALTKDIDYCLCKLNLHFRLTIGIKGYDVLGISYHIASESVYFLVTFRLAKSLCDRVSHDQIVCHTTKSCELRGLSRRLQSTGYDQIV